jgi:hypothetical protein
VPLDRPAGSRDVVPHAVPRAPHGDVRGYLPPFDGGRRDAAAVRQVLSDVSVRAELAAVGLVAGEDRRAVAMLAETARALHGLLGDARPGAPASPAPARPAGGVPRGGERLPAALVRVARMEQWLTTRAHEDAAAEPAADLCLWVLEHCEP